MSTAVTTPAKDLTKQAPASPRTRVGGYAILSRMADKGRATLAGTNGEYHFNCPLDNFLFGFKGVTGEQVKQLLVAGASDGEIAAWLDTHGTPKTTAEIKAWSDQVEAANPYNDPEKRDWFVEQTSKLGFDASKVTLFDWLEADDLATFRQ
ncbi:MAG TPA: DUF5069 domain-containing protein [Chthoniobacteraceae bacterium]|nr:DUF5069 domain-containing protein [Chthoniobacteraceae bacterium]